MSNYKQALSLGFELTSFIIVSYLAYKPLAQKFQWDENLTLGILMGLSLFIWTLHGFLYFQNKE